MDWNPNMDEAPKDGTAIDLWVRSGAASYRLTDCQWIEDFDGAGWANYRQYDEALHDSGLQLLREGVTPTHWMPLPKPPTDQHYRKGEAA